MNPANRLNLIISVLMIVLGLPAGAILVSNHALPGDSLYPVKTSLEKIAGLIISPSYQARSDLEIKLIQRRIEENQQLLLSSGSTEGLNLLLAQAQSAAEYIVKSNTSTQAKSAAIKKLSSVIKTTQQTLKQERQVLANRTITQTSTSRSTLSQGNSPIAETPSLPVTDQNPSPPVADTAQQIIELEQGDQVLDEINTYIISSLTEDLNYSLDATSEPSPLSPEADDPADESPETDNNFFNNNSSSQNNSDSNSNGRGRQNNSSDSENDSSPSPQNSDPNPTPDN